MVDASVLKFHKWIPHEKKDDPYFFSFLSYAPFLNYLPLKKNLENLVCKISQKVFELVLSYLVIFDKITEF